MAIFVEVVKARGFRGAADALGLPNSTVSRRIALLEKAIGLRLLNRTTRRVELTEAGQLYFERSARIVGEARLAHEQLGDLLAQPVGRLRISLPVDFAAVYLTPLLAEFVALYPGIEFELDLNPRQVDLVSEPFDLAIRMGQLADSGLIVRQLGRMSRQLYAAPTYIQKRGRPDHPSDLERHDCICMPRETEWVLTADAGEVRVPVNGRFRLNNVGMSRSLATHGQGIAMLTEAMARADVDAGRLLPILPAWQGPPVTVQAVTETRLLPAKTQRFIAFLQDRLRAR